MPQDKVVCLVGLKGTFLSALAFKIDKYAHWKISQFQSFVSSVYFDSITSLMKSLTSCYASVHSVPQKSSPSAFWTIHCCFSVAHHRDQPFYLTLKILLSSKSWSVFSVSPFLFSVSLSAPMLHVAWIFVRSLRYFFLIFVFPFFLFGLLMCFPSVPWFPFVCSVFVHSVRLCFCDEGLTWVRVRRLIGWMSRFHRSSHPYVTLRRQQLKVKLSRNRQNSRRLHFCLISGPVYRRFVACKLIYCNYCTKLYNCFTRNL